MGAPGNRGGADVHCSLNMGRREGRIPDTDFINQTIYTRTTLIPNKATTGTISERQSLLSWTVTILLFSS